MKPRASLILILLISAFCTGCASRIFFDHQKHRLNLNLTDEEVANLQYYLYNDIELSRHLSDSEREVAPNHQLVIRNGQRTEIILFPHGIPGIAQEVGERSLVVQFEQLPNFEKPTLTFTVQKKRSSDRNSDIFRFYTFCLERVGYAGKSYEVRVRRVESGDWYKGNCAVLQIRADALEEKEKEAREVPGMKFPDA